MGLAAVILGFIVDAIIGDPYRLPHPVRYIGWWISKLERFFRKICKNTPRGECIAGVLMAICVLIITGVVSSFVLWICMRISIWLYFIISIIICWQCLAAKCLKDEALKVTKYVKDDDINAARTQIGMLVGRDTKGMSMSDVIRAAVETVAENTSDGVVAPMFWMMIGGPVGGLLNKAVNTMDSMVGYKNEKYINFGCIPARLDDVLNYIPARLTAIFMIAVSGILKLDMKGAYRIWKRDRRNHKSPNSAQGESACAGALGVQLGGDAVYFGVLHKKPTIGDKSRELEANDISKSCKLMYGASVLGLIVFSCLGILIHGLRFIYGI